jgi:hypothetical protein
MSEFEDEFLTEVETTIKTQKAKRKKGINSKKKGNNNENECKKILNERFDGVAIFQRTPNSGAFVGGQNFYRKEQLNEEQNLLFVGDLYCNRKDLKFTIEHKAYAEASFWDLFNESSDLHSWMKQAEHDAESVGKQPMLIVKYNNKKRIVYLKKDYIDSLEGVSNIDLETVFSHNGWNCYWLEDLLKETDSFFFEEEK